MRNFYLTGMIGLSVVGCAEVSEPAETSGTSAIIIDTCEDHVCGNANTPVIGHMGFHELDATKAQAETRSQLKITNFTVGGVSYGLRVQGAEILATKLSNPAIVEKSGSLIDDARLTLTRGQTTFVVKIKWGGRAAYWKKTNATTTPYYSMFVDVGVNDWKNLCSGPFSSGDGTMGLPKDALVVFEGDRISPTTWNVEGPVQPNWFTIGCAVDLPSKLHIAGLTHAASRAYPTVFNASQDDKNAFVNMMSADYCNTGHATTIQGQPLQFRSDLHSRAPMNIPLPFHDDKVPLDIEGRWTASGASCLNTPRLIANSSLESKAIFENDEAVITAIKAECGALPPLCVGDENSPLVAPNVFVSANPTH